MAAVVLAASTRPTGIEAHTMVPTDTAVVGRLRVSDRLDHQAGVFGVSYRPDLGRVGCDDGVVSPDRALDNGDILDVVVGCLTGQHAHSSSLFIGETFDFAQREEPRQVRLSAPTPPRLGDHRGRNRHDRRLPSSIGAQRCRRSTRCPSCPARRRPRRSPLRDPAEERSNASRAVPSTVGSTRGTTGVAGSVGFRVW